MTSVSKNILSSITYVLLLVLMVSIHFEAVLTVPLDIVREGAKLKFFDIFGIILIAVTFSVYLITKRFPLSLLQLLGLIVVLLLLSLLGPSDNYSNMLFTAAWLLVSIASSIIAVRIISTMPTINQDRLINSYLNLASLLYLVAVADYVVQFATGVSIFPEAIDLRQHQSQAFPGIGAVPRFEGYATLSLGFIGLGYVNLVLALLYKRYVVALFYGILIFAGLSVGGLAAAFACLLFIFFSKLNIKSRLIFFVPLLVIGLMVMVYLFNLKAAAKGGEKWSINVRQELYAVAPRVLATDPLGMGLGQSRFLVDYINRYSIRDFPTLEVKLIIQRIIIVESSHLELVYEFGWVGLLIFLAFTWRVGKTTYKAFHSRNLRLLLIASIPLFFYIHGFLNPSYYYQMKFWFFVLLSFYLFNRLTDQQTVQAQNDINDIDGAA